MFGNHFRILNARMVQSMELVWTVLKQIFMYVHLFILCISKNDFKKCQSESANTFFFISFISMHIINVNISFRNYIKNSLAIAANKKSNNLILIFPGISALYNIAEIHEKGSAHLFVTLYIYVSILTQSAETTLPEPFS